MKRLLLPPAMLSLVLMLTAIGVLGMWLSAPTSSNADWSETARRILEGSVNEPIVTAAPVPPNPRRTGVAVGLVIAALLTILYAYRRRPYVAHWAAAWVLLALSYAVIARGYGTAEQARLAVGVLELAKVGIALLFYRSAHSIAGTVPLTTRDWLLVPGVLLWLILATDRVSVALALAPAYLIAGLIYSRAAWLFFSIFLARRMIGVLLLAGGLTVVGLTNVAFGIFFGQVLGSATMLLAFLTSNSFAFLIAAFGMTLTAFEELTSELKTANVELQHAHDELQRLATVDALTGCYNRHFFDQNIRHELQRHHRYGMPLSVLFVDVDRFKKINDTYGHEVGDRVLRHVGAFLREHVREADYVIRWGGDEFLVLMTCPGTEAAQKVALLKSSFEHPQAAPNGFPASVSVSIGSTEIPPGVSDILPFIERADRNMYLDKGTSAAPS